MLPIPFDDKAKHATPTWLVYLLNITKLDRWSIYRYNFWTFVKAYQLLKHMLPITFRMWVPSMILKAWSGFCANWRPSCSCHWSPSPSTPGIISLRGTTLVPALILALSTTSKPTRTCLGKSSTSSSPSRLKSLSKSTPTMRWSLYLLVSWINASKGRPTHQAKSTWSQAG